MIRALPWIVLGLAVFYMAGHAKPPSMPEDGMDIHAFGKIPVAYNGRVKPLDTLARTQLRIISEKETFEEVVGKKPDGTEELKRRPAIRWLLDVFTGSKAAHEHRVFRVVHPQVQHAMGVEARAGHRFAIVEFGDSVQSLVPQFRSADAKRQAKQELSPEDRDLLSLAKKLNLYQQLAQHQEPHVVPPSKEHPEWRTLEQGLDDGHGHGSDPNAQSLVKILRAYADKDAATFNAEVAAYRSRLAGEQPKASAKASFETFFNRLDPFLLCKVFYIGGFLLAVGAWMGWAAPLNRSAYALIWFSWIVHTLGLIFRIYLSGRPPVTNLYSSAVFIGWGMVLLGLVFERIYRLGVGNVVSAVAGFSTLLIAHVLSADGDTMEVLQAVLDTQFWLATHVTTITLGYSATFVAGLVGIVYVLQGFFTRTLDDRLRAIYARMMYGSVCFATFFSFVGTVLGGLWADDSWGRFWGWDPKENGALMIVLWNALLLHARWGGMVRERGLAVLSIFGNVVTTWSWFGVNNLGIGLHSYGFTEGVFQTLMIFVASQLAIMGLGMAGRRHWKSPDAVREKAQAA